MLSNEEELALKGYIVYMQSINHSPSIAAVKAFSRTLAKKSNAPSHFNTYNGPEDKWYQNFKKRHNLTNRKPDNVDGGRLRMANTTVWKQYFDLLEATIDKLGLRHEPNAILQWINAMN